MKLLVIPNIYNFNINYLEIFGISKSCAWKTYKRYKIHKTFHSLERTGAPRKITKRDTMSIIRTSANNPHLTSSDLSALFNEENEKTISAEHVRRILRLNGLFSYAASRKPFLTKKTMQKRKKFAKEHMNEQKEYWRNFAFSDESYFTISLIRRFKSTNPYLSCNIRPTVKLLLKVMVWGCFSYYGIGRLEICHRYVNRQYYKELLQNKLLPSIEKF